MLYVAYGSNMNLEQMKYRCPNSKVIGNGKIEGWKLIFNIHADIIKGSKKDLVPVVVWDIAKEDFDSLDRYEGYPHYYIRKKIPVRMVDGSKINAIVYVMVDDAKGICPPYEKYFNVCKQGYNDNGINLKYLYDALEYSWDNETEYNQYNRRGKRR